MSSCPGKILVGGQEGGRSRKKRREKRGKGERTVGLPLPRRRPTVLHTATRRTTCAARRVGRAIYTR